MKIKIEIDGEGVKMPSLAIKEKTQAIVAWHGWKAIAQVVGILAFLAFLVGMLLLLLAAKYDRSGDLDWAFPVFAAIWTAGNIYWLAVSLKSGNKGECVWAIFGLFMSGGLLVAFLYLL